MKAKAIQKYSPQTIFGFGLVLSWLSIYFSLFSKIGFFIWLILLMILLFRNIKLATLLFVLSSWCVLPVINFIGGSVNYFRGQASLKYVGLPGAEFYNLNPEYRVWNSSSGCVLMGYEPFTQYSNNFAVKSWTKLLGYQKGVYRGNYPDRISAENILLQQGKEVEFTQDDSSFNIGFEGKSYLVERLFHRNQAEFKGTARAMAVKLDDGLMLFMPIQNESYLFLSLIDLKNAKIFAEYHIEN